MTNDFVIHTYQGRFQNLFKVRSRARRGRFFQINYEMVNHEDRPDEYPYTIDEIKPESLPFGNEILRNFREYLNKGKKS